MDPRNYYSCSSWNYGSYAPCNPCFIQQCKPSAISNQNKYIPSNQNANVYNRYGKRVLHEQERIVTII